jgi:hypothetical protein
VGRLTNGIWHWRVASVLKQGGCQCHPHRDSIQRRSQARQTTRSKVPCPDTPWDGPDVSWGGPDAPWGGQDAPWGGPDAPGVAQIPPGVAQTPPRVAETLSGVAQLLPGVAQTLPGVALTIPGVANRKSRSCRQKVQRPPEFFQRIILLTIYNLWVTMWMSKVEAHRCCS